MNKNILYVLKMVDIDCYKATDTVTAIIGVFDTREEAERIKNIQEEAEQEYGDHHIWFNIYEREINKVYKRWE